MKQTVFLKLSFFILLFVSFSIHAQEDLKIKPVVRIFVLHPFHQGDNAFTDAYSAGVGFGGHLFLLKYHNFRLGFGGDYIPYDVEKENMIATIKSNSYSSIYGLISYDVNLTEKFNLSPVIGLGASRLRMKTRDRKIDSQNGTEFRIGFYSDYTFSPNYAGFVGLYYISNRFKINTHPDFEDYFGKSSSIQVSLGLKFF